MYVYVLSPSRIHSVPSSRSRLATCAVRTAILVVVLGLAGNAFGAPKLWTGAVNGNFNNANNWSPAGVPAAGDDLIFQPPPVSQLLVTNNFSPNRAFNSITFQGSNYFVRGNP